MVKSYFFILLVFLAACAPAPKEVATSQPVAPVAAAPANSAPAASDLPMPPQSAAKWDAPKAWKLGPEKPMRSATYLIPAASGDAEGGECAVFANIGGGVQANVDRWIGQFKQADGSDSKAKAKTEKKTVSGLPATLIDLTGTFNGGGAMMNPGAPPPAEKTGYRLLGAIVEAPSGPLYFKLTGPAKTVAAAQTDFMAMLNSLK
jgi:hypothetical protein